MTTNWAATLPTLCTPIHWLRLRCRPTHEYRLSLSLPLSLSLSGWHCLSQFLWPFLTFLQFPIPICILLPLLLQFAFVAFVSPVCRGLKCRILSYTLHTLQMQRTGQCELVARALRMERKLVSGYSASRALLEHSNVLWPALFSLQHFNR